MIDIINNLIEKHFFNSFLLIGDDINIFNGVKCEKKLNVTDYDNFYKSNKEKFDLILIDGLHHAEQAEKDILEAWKRATAKGIILIHDVKPHDEAMQEVPRKQAVWTGNVWKAWHGFISKFTKIKAEYIDENYGLGVIYKSKNKITKGFVSDIDFKEYHSKKLWLKK